MTTRTAFLTALLVAAGACAPAAPDLGLDGVEWVLDASVTPAVDLVEGRPSRDLPGGVRATVEFTSAPSGPTGFFGYRGHTGCNGYGGTYRVVDEGPPGAVRIETDGAPEATRVGCPEPQATVEQAVLSALRRTAAVHLRGGVGASPTRAEPAALALFDADGELLLLFRRRAVDAAVAEAVRDGAWRFASSEVPGWERAGEATLTFGDELYLGENGCARAGGFYSLDGDALEVRPNEYPPTCPPGEDGRPVPIASGRVSVRDGRLVLVDRDGMETVYERVP